MTKEEFLINLAKTRERFEWQKYGPHIRTGFRVGKAICCPLTAVCYSMTGVKFDIGNYTVAGQEIELDFDLITSIMRSADKIKISLHYDESLRKEMLTALGLEPDIENNSSD